MKHFTLMFCLLFGLSMNLTACDSDDTDFPDKQQPGNSNPGNTDPGNTDPGNTDPGNTDPGNTDPGNTDPGNTDPGNTDPGNTEPGNTDPGNTDPGNTDPGNTDPGNTDPGNTDPGNESTFNTENGKWKDDGYETGYQATIHSTSYTVNDKGTITEVEMLPKYASMGMTDLINEFCEHEYTTCGNVSHNYKSLSACKSEEKKASNAAARCSSAVRAYYILYIMMPCSVKCAAADYGSFSSLEACTAGDSALLSLLGMFMGCEN